MKFEERLNELISEAEVPDELLPKNIARMLKAQSEQPKMITEHKKMKNAPSASAQRRTIIMRTAAAAAACAVFAAGMLAYSEQQDTELRDPVVYEEVVVTPDSHDDLFKIYTGRTLNGGEAETEITPDNNGLETIEDFSGYDLRDSGGGKIAEPDIVKSDGKYLYCLKDDTLYIISLETMEVVSEIQSTLDPPVDIYRDGGRVILISEETEEIQAVGNVTDTADSNAEVTSTASDVPANDADTQQSADGNSDITLGAFRNEETGRTVLNVKAGESAIPVSRTNTIVDIYDVSNAASPIHTQAYKQNGSYTASRLVNGSLYTVTDYSDYRVKPLSSQADLDSFVPAYYINGEKFYLDAGDITVLSGTVSTDYTVISAIGANGGETEVKAVLGSGGNVCCSEDTIYTVGIGKKDGAEYSIISAFDISGGNVSYRESGSVEGIVLGRGSMNEYGGKFRTAAEITDGDGLRSVSVYVMDKSLTVINSAGQLARGENVTAVRFEEDYARIFLNGESKASAAVNLTSSPPAMSRSPICDPTFLYSFGDGLLLGIGEAESGEITLTVYSKENGLVLSETAAAENGAFSKALTDRRAALVDIPAGIIGLPVYGYNEFGTVNSYFVYCYDETAGLVRKGFVEYVDINDSMLFKRGKIIDDTLYIVSEGRIVAARLSDLKVIGSYEY